MTTDLGMRRNARSAKLRVLALPIFGLSLLPLAAQAGPVLPTGARVVAGSAAVTTPSPTQLTVNQSSAKAIIDWQGFSIGSGGTVQFNNGSGATLNRVTGSAVSSIDGRLSATGSVYLINANGVVVGKTGMVSTGGTFVASSLDVKDAQFLSGGDLTFSGTSNAAVVNYGKIGSLGGDVALFAAKVDNQGSISAPNGAAGLAAGYQVVLHDGALNGGKFSVVTGGSSTAVSNAGAIAAAEAELRANGGNIYALAGNTGGIIKATGVAAGGGKVMLIAEGGAVTVGGTISARGAGGAGGSIETSGSTVNIGAASIDAGAGGSWLLDPNDLTIDQTAANTIAATLNAGTNVTQQTTSGGTGGNGDIFVAPSVNLQWTTGAGLTLSAYRNISVGAGDFIASTGGGAVTLAADNAATGVGTVSFGSGAAINTAGQVTIFYNPASYGDSATRSTVSGGNPYQGFVAAPGGAPDQLTAYMLVNTAADLAAIDANPYDQRLDGVYALNAAVDISANPNWTPIGISPGNGNFNFTGVFDGQNHTISGLTISLSGSNVGEGLFSANAGVIKNLMVTNASVSVGCCFTGATGVVAGVNFGTISNVQASGSDYGSFILGGLVGIQYSGGTISDSSSSVVVSAPQFTRAGGLVGSNAGLIQRSYATGSVSANNYGGSTGGLVGENAGTGVITQAYATGDVSMSVGPAGNSTFVGGFVGQNSGAISQAYATGATSFLINDETLQVFATYAVGAFAGDQEASGSISQAYATGHVTAVNSWTPSCTGCGNGPSPVFTGFAAYQVSGATQSATYYDSTTTGLGGGLTTAQMFSAANMPGLTFTTTPGGNGWVIVDADGSFNNAGGVAGATRPMLASEYSTSISNAHQLQLMGLNPNAAYTLTGDIDASATGGAAASGLWTASGFVPIGIDAITVFNGAFDGQGHTISGLNINRPNDQYLGLFGYVGLTGSVKDVTVSGSVSGSGLVGLIAGENDGVIKDVNVSGVATGAAGGSGYVSLIAGYDTGSITGGSAAGSVSGPSSVGPVVGFFAGGASVTLAHYDVDQTLINGGHSLTFGGLYDAQYQDWITHGQALNPINYFGAPDANGVYTVASVADFENLLGFADVSGLKFKLTGNLDMTAAPGFYIPMLNGVTFDGAGYTISNLNLNMGGSTSVGLFAYVDGTVQNLTVTGSASGFSQVGLIAGFVDAAGSLIHDTASGTVTGSSYVGLMTGNTSGTMVNDNAMGTVTGSLYSGGVTGFYGAGSTFTNSHYDVDTVTINGGHALTTGGLYDAQYQDWIGHGETLDIANYLGTPDANGFYSIGSVADLTNMLGFVDVAGLKFKMTADIDLTPAAGFYIPVFNGAAFDGAGFTVSNIQVSQNNAKTGFFGFVNTGSISNLGVVGGSVTGAHMVGGLVGYDLLGTITNSYSTATVHGGNYAGGLVGLTYGDLTGDYATGPVSGTVYVGGLVGMLGFNGEKRGTVTDSYATGSASGNRYVGGLVADNQGVINYAYATGAVHTNIGWAGGLVGLNEAGTTIDQAYATGAVSGGANPGGLVGVNSGAVTNAYWDTTTSGQTSSAAGVGLTTSQFFTAANMPGFAFGATSGGNGWVIVDADGTLNNAGGAAGAVRPLLLSEYSTSVSNAHQLQLMALDLSASYTLARNVDAAATQDAGAAGVWSASGFVPIGGNGAGYFTGSLDGRGHAVSNLYINDTTPTAIGDASGFKYTGTVGLIGGAAGGSLIQNIALTNATVTGGDGMLVGALVGSNGGLVVNASSSGVVTVGNAVAGDTGAAVGGLVGGMAGSVSNSSSSATVTGGSVVGAAGVSAGGLVGSAVDGASITGSFASGAVSIGDSTAAVGTGGYVQAGGLLGVAYGYALAGGTPTPNAVTVSGSYATGSVTGGAGSIVGGFAGSVNDATVTASYATGSVTQTAAGVNGHNNLAGGFAGVVSSTNGGAGVVSQSYASGVVTTVTGSTSSLDTLVGGFVGDVDVGGLVNNSYALGSVTAPGANNLMGGFVGILNGGAVDTAYATGMVTGGGLVGGFVGYWPSGNLTGSYWDTGTTGQANAAGFTPLSTVGMVAVGGTSGNNAYAQNTYGSLDFNTIWAQADGFTRPVLRMEASSNIVNAHQLQLMAANPAGTYTLAADIDLSVTSNPSEVWNPATGYVPIGANGDTPFTGTFDGQGHTINNLMINRPNDSQIGFIGVIGAGGVVKNVTVSGSVSGFSEVGLITGENDGALINAIASGTATGASGGSGYVSLVAGYNTGSITGGGAQGSVSGPANVGPIAGYLASGSSVSNAHYDIDTVMINGAHALMVGGLYDAQFQDWNSHGLMLNPVSYFGAPDANGVFSITNLTDFKNLLGFADLPGLQFKLTGDIDMTSAADFYIPMVNGAIIDGAGHTISGLSLNIPGSTSIGLFGYDKGTIENLTVTGSVSGGSQVGLVTGYVDTGGSLINVTGSGAVSASSYVGLVSGFANGAVVNANAVGTVAGSSYYGGVTGFYGAGSTFTNSHYDVDTVTINGGHAVTPGALYDAQYQDWIGHGETLNIASYFAAPDANGFYSINNLADLQNMLGFADVAGLKFKMTANIDLTPAAGFYIPLFNGAAFDGGGFVVGNIQVNQKNAKTGFFGFVNTGSISNLGVVGGSVTGAHMVGGLVGYDLLGTITNSYSTATVHGGSYAGGLVGLTYGDLVNDFSAGSVSGTAFVGGLVAVLGYNGEQSGVITNSFASGPVTGDLNVGGLVGDDYGSVTFSYATGSVHSNFGYAGGLIGFTEVGSMTDQTYATGFVNGDFALGGLVGGSAGGTVTNSYWDEQTTAMAGSQGGVGLTTAQFLTASNMPGFTFGTATGGAGWVIIDGDGTLNNAGGAAGAVRPMLLSEWSTQINNTHELQLMVLNPSASYVLNTNLNAQATSGASASGLWTTAGFVPVGIDGNVTFTGSFDGQGHSITNLNINRPGDSYLGLIGYLDTGATLTNVQVQGTVTGAGDVGLLAGFTNGTLTNAAASGSVSGGFYFGPVTGFYGAGSTLTNAHYDIDTTTINGGHAVTVGGMYDAQYQDWGSHGGSLNIASYFGAPDANGFYSLGSVADLQNLLGFADQTGLKFKLTANIDLTSAPGFYIPLFDGAAFDGAGFTINNIQVNQNNAKTGFLGYVAGADITNLGVVGGSVTGHHMVGGLIGYQLAGTLTNSYSTANVTGGSFAGGLVGLEYGAMTNDYATGTVKGSSVIGGLVGGLFDLGTPSVQGTITSSYATGEVHGNYDTGGLVGDNAGTISQSYATGPVSGPQVTGGLVGWAETTSIINQSYASGTVAGTGAIGGLVGDNAGMIAGAYASGSVNGNDSVGGLIGFSENTANVDQTFSTGMVVGVTNTGGLIGANAGALTNSYWDTETSGLATSSGGVGQTTAQLQAQLPAGFDPSIWTQVAGSSFPYFAWQFSTQPEVIAGTVYTGIGGTIVVGAHVSGYENGASVGSATTGANGYYQILVAANSIVNADLFTYLTSVGSTDTTGGSAIGGVGGVGVVGGSPKGNAFASNVTGSITSLNIYEGYLYAQTADTTMSALQASVNHAIGANTDPGLLYTPGSGIAGGANLWIKTAGDFTADDLIQANDVRLEINGDFTISASGQVAATGGGDAIIIASNGDFINDAGASGVSNINVDGRWLIYSQARDSQGGAPTGDVFGGLVGKSFYGDAYMQAGTVNAGFAIEPNSGDRFVFGYQPTLTITAATGDATYNGQSQTDSFTVQGLQNGDSATDAVQGAFTTGSKNVGVYTFNSGLMSDENYALNYVSGALTITPASLTLSGLSATSKVYDGTTGDTLTGSVVDDGVLASDVGTVSLIGSAVGTFADQHAGTGKDVTVSGLSLTGANASNYALVPLVLSADITPMSVTAAFVGTIEKTYDGTKVAAFTTTDTQLTGEVASDIAAGSLTLSGIAAYSSKNAGTNLTVNATGVSLSGSSAQDYVLTNKSFSSTSGVIDAAAVTANLIGTVSKVYNGDMTATLAAANYQLTGVIAGDTVRLNNPSSGAYSQKDVGTGLDVTVTGAGLSGAGASNYVLTSSTIVGAVGVITPKTLTDSLVGPVTKTYDGTNLATLTNANYSLAGVIGGDGVTLNNPTIGTYSSATAGARSVTVTGLALENNAAGDYVLASSSLTSAIGTIDPKTVTAAFSGPVEKTYNGTTAASLGGGVVVLVGEVASDVTAGSVGLKGTAAYAAKNVGSGLLVSVSSAVLTGANAVDYVLASRSFSDNVGVIDPKAITASLSGTVAKVYDGSTAATLAAKNYRITGMVAGDSLSLNNPVSGTYAQKDVGTGLTITVDGAALTGGDAGNYVLVDPTIVEAIGKITPVTLVDSLTGSVTKTYDGTNVATLTSDNYSLAGVVAGDSVTLNDPTTGTYASANAGHRGVTVTGLALLNNSAGDYILKSASLTSNIGVISPKVLTANLTGVVDKTYDTTTTATLTAGNYSLTGGVIAGDIVALNNPTRGAFAGKDVGSGLMVMVSGLKLAGASAANYTLSASSASAAIGEIDPKVLTASLIGKVSRVYDATTVAALTASNFKLAGAYASDGITLASPTSGAFDNKNVGSGKTITASGLTLNNNAAGDYVLASTTVSAAAGTITPFTLSVTLNGPVTKTYDGTTVATLTSANYNLLTPFDGDSVALNDPANGTYASKGSATLTTTGIKVTVSGLALTGSDAGNYKLKSTTVTGNVGTIAKKPN